MNLCLKIFVLPYSPIFICLCILQNARCLLCCHSLLNLLVKVGVKFILFHPLKLILRVDFLRKFLIKFEYINLRNALTFGLENFLYGFTLLYQNKLELKKIYNFKCNKWIRYKTIKYLENITENMKTSNNISLAIHNVLLFIAKGFRYSSFPFLAWFWYSVETLSLTDLYKLESKHALGTPQSSVVLRTF